MVSLNVAIIGAGTAGLATALALSRQEAEHKITVYEAVSELTEIGDGIGLAPNAVRVIQHLGIYEELRRVIFAPKAMRLRRYANDAEVGEIPQNPISEIRNGYPAWVAYRPDLQRILKEACDRVDDQKIKIILGKAVKSVDHEKGMLVFKDGSEVTADLIVGADGIRSHARPCIPVNANTPAKATYEYCFRTVVTRDQMMADPVTAEFVKLHCSVQWMGPGSVLLVFPISAGEKYAVILVLPRDGDPDYVGKWGHPGDIHEGAKVLEPFSEQAQRIWSKVTECKKWTIGYLPPIPTLASENGKVVLVGDAAHAMVPHVGQGGAMAFEDAASLAIFISSLKSKSELPKTMAKWSSFRETRVKNVRRIAEGNQIFMSLPDGPEQEKRDQLWGEMTAAAKAERESMTDEAYQKHVRSVKPNPDAKDVRTPEARMYLHGYDVVGDAKKAVKELRLS